MNKLRGAYEQLSPKKKQLLLYGAIVAVLAVVVVTFMGKPVQHVRKVPPSKTMFTDTSAKKLSDEALAAEVRNLKSEAQGMKKELEMIHEKEAKSHSQAVTEEDLQRLRLEMKTDLQNMQEKTERNDYVDNAQLKAPGSADQSSGNSDEDTDNDATAVPATSATPAPTFPHNSAAASASGAGASSGTVTGGSGSIRVIGGAPQSLTTGMTTTPDGASKPMNRASASKPANHVIASALNVRDRSSTRGSLADDATENFIPAGSTMRGILLSGMDAPTAKNARQDPYPVLIRITDDAILPNFYRANLSECFVLAAGYGDLSSERLMLRAQTLSCVTASGGVIETPLKGYATGEDGKVGLRGRLVNKQSALIARAMMAGFLQSFSALFNRNPVPVIATAPTSTTEFQSMLGAGSLQGAAAQGAGGAMEKLAQYYLDLADAIHPVIEVDAGRTIDLIVENGISVASLSQ